MSVFASVTSGWTSLQLVMALVQAVLGMAMAVWFVRLRSTGQAQAASTPPPPDQTALEHLQRLAAQIETQVHDHTSQMQAIDRQLVNISADPAAAADLIAELTRQLLSSNERLKGELDSAQQTLRSQQEQLDAQLRAARTDALTQLFNRRHFDEELTRRFAQWRRQHTPLSVLLLDVDHFKQFNDEHGHALGDRVLCHVAATIGTTMRDMDVVARYGGEEFAVMLPGTNLANGKLAAERVRKAVEAAALQHGGKTLRVNISVGLAQAMPGDEPETLVARADSALYDAKRAGRNRGHFHNGSASLPILGSESPQPTADERAAVEQAIRRVEPQMYEPDEDHSQRQRAVAVAEPEFEAELAVAEPEEASFVERRRIPRTPARMSQYVAPQFGNTPPAPRSFREVQCDDVSSAGFSYLSNTLPESESLVVEFGISPNVVYLSAKVIHKTTMPPGQGWRFRIGCRFVGRIEMR